jgi:MFS family permease
MLYHLAPHHRVFAAFFLYAFSMGGLYPRLPEIRAQLGIEEGALGLALMGVAAGMLVSLTFIVPKVGDHHYRRYLLTLLPMVSIGFAIAGHANHALVLFAVLFGIGLILGVIETIVNVEADRVEHQLNRRIMIRSHAFWSFGFFGAGGVSALAADYGLSPATQLWSTAVLVVLLTYLVMGNYQPAAPRHTALAAAETTHPTPRWTAPTAGIMLLVSVCGSALLLEGAGLDWSAIYMSDVFNSPPALAAIAVSTVAFSQAITRFFADTFVERFGAVKVARVLLLNLLIGTATVTWANNPAIALVGFAFIGFGASALFPLCVSAAAQRTDRPAHLNVAAIGQNGFIIFLLAPPLLGFIAEHLGIRWSFGLTLPLILLSLATSGYLRHTR